MGRAVILRRQHYQEIVAHALKARPNECCGLVACHGIFSACVHQTRNIEPSPHGFVIDSAEQLAVLEEIDTMGHWLGAVYHSHPEGEPDPSPVDVQFAKSWPGVEWIIVGVIEDIVTIRSWKIDTNIHENKTIVAWAI